VLHWNGWAAGLIWAYSCIFRSCSWSGLNEFIKFTFDISICKIFQHLVQSSERHPSAVQTPGFSPPAPAKKNMAPGKKSPAPPENFQLRQIRENSKWKQIFVFDFNI
jgi:hypothetical protein